MNENLANPTYFLQIYLKQFEKSYQTVGALGIYNS